MTRTGYIVLFFPLWVITMFMPFDLLLMSPTGWTTHFWYMVSLCVLSPLCAFASYKVLKKITY